MLHGMPELGPLLASGRDADIFAYGRDLVVRRSRRGRSMEREARIMRYVARHGYPAPRVEDVRANGSELVMERIDGPTMLEVLSKRPWTLRRNAGRLAMLHHRLHEISAPDWLERVFGGGDRVIHLDLHPLNVILSPQGPRLIDWTNAVDAVRTALPAVGMWKCEDRNMRPAEVAAMRQLVAAESSQR
ncbi:MAG: hypothetical protein DMD76_04835 [Candidatus Rokuibacteriota bacterium]|nr:MAG: hypothetical protein DMD76_04835 [Candidatus Rokubacteria bacterium]